MRKANPNKQYFTKEAEDAIIRYNLSESPAERDRIYNEYIHKPLDKLVECIIHTFKLDSYAISYEEVKHDTLTYIVERLYKYTDPTMGKAYSYFSIVCKNRLIAQNDLMYKRHKLSDQTEQVDVLRSVMNEQASEYDTSNRNEFIELYIKYLDTNLETIFRTKEDQIVADSVLELFRIRENIECFNKKSLYILIRDRTGVETTAITKVVNQMKRLYTSLYKIFLRTGALNVTQGKYNKALML